MPGFLKALLAALVLAGPSPTPSVERVLLKTGAGDVELEVDRARAPVTAANFLRYVDAGHYEGGRFHRTVRLTNQPQNKVKIEVIQGGAASAREAEAFPPIPLERTNLTGLRHSDGALSMARDGPDTAQSDFFICIGDQPELDFEGKRNPDGQGFAAFGKVIKGMDIVRAIQKSPAEEQVLKPAVAIVSIKRRF